MEAFHSDLLHSFTSYLPQIIDVIFFIRSCKAVHTKLFVHPAIIDRITQARRRYASFNLYDNLRNAATDQQYHFIEQLSWVSEEAYLQGIILSGNVPLVQQWWPTATNPTDITSPDSLKAAGQSGSMDMVEYILKFVSSTHEERAKGFIAEGAATRGELKFVSELIPKFGGEGVLYHNSIFSNAIRSNNIDLVKYIIDTLHPQQSYFNIVNSFITPEMYAFLLGYYPRPITIDEEFLFWFLFGNMDKINQHPDCVKNVDYEEVLYCALRHGSEEVIALALSLIPETVHCELIRLVLQLGDPRLIVRYISRGDAMVQSYGNPSSLAVILDRFNPRLTPKRIRTMLGQAPNLSSVYQFAKQNLEMLIEACSHEHEAYSVSRVIQHEKKIRRLV